VRVKLLAPGLPRWGRTRPHTPGSFGALAGVAVALAALAAAPDARADTSAWMFFGFGTLGLKPGTGGGVMMPDTLVAEGTMTIEAGAGTSPDAPVIVGGMFRIQPIFHQGTDIAWLLRVCTHGFQAGSFGVALDVGPFARFWGIESGGFAGAVNVGFPLGFTLSLQTEVGTSRAITFGAVAGIDLLRLTVYRQTLLKWWDNPSPVWKVPQRTAGLSF
jgi:hypothetical protein